MIGNVNFITQFRSKQSGQRLPAESRENNQLFHDFAVIGDIARRLDDMVCNTPSNSDLDRRPGFVKFETVESDRRTVEVCSFDPDRSRAFDPESPIEYTQKVYDNKGALIEKFQAFRFEPAEPGGERRVLETFTDNQGTVRLSGSTSRGFQALFMESQSIVNFG